jgi:aldose 1-epimerase
MRATRIAPSGHQWRIAAAGHEAVLVEVGGGIREYAWQGVPVLDGYPEDAIAPHSAGHILAPWPNRIRDGQYTFGGRQHQLPLTEPARHNAMHGLVNWAPWDCAAHTEDSVTLTCRLPPRPGYPWPLDMRTTWTVGEAGLTATHEITNAGSEPAPFGLGAHPYVRIAGVDVDDITLTVPAQSRLLTDSRLLPIGAAKVTGGPLDFVDGRRLGAIELDTAFGDLTAVEGSEVRLSGGGREVVIWADGAFRWWQVFTGDSLSGERRRRSIAVEPMTCPPDAFRSHRDLIELAPGQVWRASWGIRPS